MPDRRAWCGVRPEHSGVLRDAQGFDTIRLSEFPAEINSDYLFCFSFRGCARGAAHDDFGFGCLDLEFDVV